MGEEYWANVYETHCRTTGRPMVWVGHCWKAREHCDAQRPNTHSEPVCRIHVRLKPEGAPRRYASEDERERWEHYSGLVWSAPEITHMTRKAEMAARRGEFGW